MPITDAGTYTPNNRIVSPGTFLKEIDQSGIAQGVADIGGVIVAPFAKGPGFTPTTLNSVADLEAQFGTADGTLYGPYTAKNYLQEKGFVTVCRVGALTGYHQKYPWVVWAEEGDWGRAYDAGWIDPKQSDLTFDSSSAYYVRTNSQILYSTTTYDPGNLFSNVAATSFKGIFTGSLTGSVSTAYGTISGSSLWFSSSYFSGSINNTAIAEVSGAISGAVSVVGTITGSITAKYNIGKFTGQLTASSVTLNGTGSGTDTYPGLTAYTGSIHFESASAYLVLTASSGTANPLTSSNSGSIYYNNTPINGFITGKMDITTKLSLTYNPALSGSDILADIIASGSLSGSIVPSGSLWNSTQYPFTPEQSGGVYIYNGANQCVVVSQSLDLCNRPMFDIFGCISGAFGAYNGTFTPGAGNYYDPCLGKWVTSGSAYKVLAVLTNTLNAPPDTQLDAPGFYGSTQSYSPGPSGSIEVNVDFDLALTQSNDGGFGLYHFSLDSTLPKYITNVFGHDPRAGNPATHAQGTKIEAAYLYKIFEDDIAVVANNPRKWYVHGNVMPSGSWTGEPLNFTDRWSLDLLNGDSQFSLTNAYTPFVLSQKISPWNNSAEFHRFPLFRALTLADGTYTNTSYKIEISQVKLAGTVAGSDWGTFTLTVRAYSDVDRKVKILEQFNRLNLDPTSPDFIARRIGDRYNYINFNGKIIEFGTYVNLSKLIRIEMATNPYPVAAVPYAVDMYAVPVNGSIGNWCNPIAFTKASVYGLYPGKYASGIDFDGPPTGADSELASLFPTSSTGQEHWRDNSQYFAPVPTGASAGSNTIFALEADASPGSNTIFALDDETTANGVGIGSFISGSNAIPAIYDAANETTYVKMRKFIFGFQGGFDGQSPSIPENLGGDIVAGNTQGLNCANSTTAGSIAYKQCIGALGNADEFDINLIATPGIIYSLHSYVTNLVVEMCETRGDCFYILDLYADAGNPSAGQIDEVVYLAQQFDTNYAGTYYPWIKIKDTNTNLIVTVPPSVVMPGVYAANDRVAAEWFAPAGLNRGGITQAVQVTDRTTHVERDTLYEGRVNPIAAFPGQGIVAWGQKTLQVHPSALDRINVRRLLIEIKKFFASTARFLVFEQNVQSTRNKFLAIVNPYLESVQQRSGIYAFQILMDSNNNSPDLIDRNILYGQIWLKPVKSAEFIILDFNILPTGASFPTA